MGLFDFLRGKTEEERIIDEMIERMFPGGHSERMFKAKVVADLSNGKMDLPQAFGAYAGARARIKLYSMNFDGESHLGPDVDQLLQGIKNASYGKLSTFEATAILYYAIFDKSDPSLETMNTIRSWQTTVYGSDALGCETNEVPWGIGEFGFDPTNPIPVRGVISNDVYLKRLRTLDGRNILYSRNGSFEVPNVPNKVDEYQISQEGNMLCRLYIHPYNRRISGRPPKGFVLVKEDK